MISLKDFLDCRSKGNLIEISRSKHFDTYSLWRNPSKKPFYLDGFGGEKQQMIFIKNLIPAEFPWPGPPHRF